ncbi:MAG: extracellular solute-binding protein [Chloroflexota bacterium]
METIYFCTFDRGPDFQEKLLNLVNEFERDTKIKVELEIIQDWSNGWARLLDLALNRSPADVSEVGSSWVSDLMRMEALRPFSAFEVDRVLSGAKLYSSVWGNSFAFNGGKTNSSAPFSIPLGIDARAIYYRHDVFERFGINEASAFESAQAFENTLELLQQVGHPTPLALPTARSHRTIHNLASWVWGEGGNFVNEEGT